MVSFSCEVCNDTLVKKKLMGHFQRCPQAVFTCIDCNTTFQGNSFQSHTSCITEAQKYEGSLYRDKKSKGAQNGQQNGKQNGQKAAAKEEPMAEPKQPKAEAKESKDSKKDTKSKTKTTSLEAAVPKGKSLNLSKVIKSMRTDKLGKKDLLKKLKVTHNDNGSITLSI